LIMIDNSHNPENNNKTDPSLLFKKLYNIIVTLRGPDGCPWDKEQNTDTMRKSIIEEAYECVNAIDNTDDSNLKEELGDILLVVSMIIRIKEQDNVFTYNDVLQNITEKLIRRHPHVFGSENFDTAEEVLINWNKIKTDVEGKKPVHSILEHIPNAFPPLEKAYAIQKKVSKVGFDWKKTGPVWEKLDEEINELKTAVQNKDKSDIEEEIGDIFFTVVNICRLMHLHPGLALNRTNEKFIKRFMKLEERMKEKNIPLEEAGLPVLDQIWDEVKKEEKRGTRR